MSGHDIARLGMTQQPGAREGATWLQLHAVNPGVRYDCAHQSASRAGTSQLGIGFDMGNEVRAIVNPVLGIDKARILLQFKSTIFAVVDHDFFCGSLYIQGNASPMGTIHNVPASA